MVGHNDKLKIIFEISKKKKHFNLLLRSIIRVFMFTFIARANLKVVKA